MWWRFILVGNLMVLALNLENPFVFEPVLITVSQRQSLLLECRRPRFPIRIDSPVRQQLQADDQHQQIGSDLKSRKVFE
jgi:hypothetical protein